jgi:hypothetical protein
MWQTRLYCPSCKELLYESELEIEGEISRPGSQQIFECDLCGWNGPFGSLLEIQPVAPATIPDFQI